MKALIQRVKQASVTVDGVIIGQIPAGILTLLGVQVGDTEADVDKLMKKISSLRIFEDELGKMNLSLLDVKGSHLIVSQFTLLGDASKGNRPSFIEAARPEIAKPLFERALRQSEFLGLPTASGKFQAHMEISLVNDGPVTLLLES